MGFYARRIFPFVVDRTLRNEDAAACRQRIVRLARGQVLEIGIGSGLNLPFYGPAVEAVIGLDPSLELLSMARNRAGGRRPPLRLLRASADAIPLSGGTIDTVVVTWTLCSVPDPSRALEEAWRILRPDGRLLFIEHGLAPEDRIASWQRRLDPLWTRISCHLDRAVDRLLADAGFDIVDVTTGYVGTGPRFVSFMYQGWARPRPDVAGRGLEVKG